jgi:glycerol kinase
MQFQADVLGIPVEVARERETTALGAAALALGVTPQAQPGRRYEPRTSEDEAERLYAGWREALSRARL